MMKIHRLPSTSNVVMTGKGEFVEDQGTAKANVLRQNIDDM
jgi:hypothetical protein